MHAPLATCGSVRAITHASAQGFADANAYTTTTLVHTHMQGLDQMGAQFDVDRLKMGLAASRQAGYDPTALFNRMMSNPALAKRVQQPRVMHAVRGTHYRLGLLQRH